MPRTRARPTRRARRTVRKATIPRYRLAVPMATHVKLRYVHSQVINKTSPDPNYILFYPNSLTDVMSISGTQQPYLRDQMWTLYDHARVIRYSISIKIVPVYAQNPLQIALAPARDGVQDTDMDLVRMRRGSVMRLGAQGRNLRPLFIREWVDHYFGNARGTALHDDQHLQTDAVDLSSSQKCTYQLLSDDMSGTITSGIPMCYIQAVVTQWVRFSSPKDQVAS